MTDGAILAFYVGPSGVVGGVKTDMLAWANKDVFLQIWIGAEDKLPRRVRAMYAADPLALRNELELVELAARSGGPRRTPSRREGPGRPAMAFVRAGPSAA